MKRMESTPRIKDASNKIIRNLISASLILLRVLADKSLFLSAKAYFRFGYLFYLHHVFPINLDLGNSFQVQ